MKRVKSFWILLVWFGLGQWGCQSTNQASLPERSPQEQRWMQAILADQKRPCVMQILMWDADTQGSLPKVIHYERPHPDFVYMTERSASSCQIAGKEFFPTLILTPDTVVRWYPQQARYRIVPRLPDKKGLQKMEQLFLEQARLRVIGREHQDGEEWVIVEATVPNGFTKRRYWISAHGEPQIKRIVVLDGWGRVMGDEQRTVIRPIRPASPPSSLPTLPSEWRAEHIPAVPLTEEDKALLKTFTPPQGYHLITAIRRPCPIEEPHTALSALYSNGLDEFSVFFAPPECKYPPPADTPPLIGSESCGVVVIGRRQDGWGLVIVGEIRPESAHEALHQWLTAKHQEINLSCSTH